MKKMIINENQKGFLFKHGKYIKLLDAGKYHLFGGKEIELSSLDQPMAWNYILNANDAAGNFNRQFLPVCFHGHTHQPRVFAWDGHRSIEMAEYWQQLIQEGEAVVQLQPGLKYFINVGSVGQPRDGDPRACYGIYDSDAATVTLRRIEYDVAAAQQAVLAVGLPEYLAERLGSGQ